MKSGKKVLAGKSAENNEELISQVRGDEIVLHTALPGSPFVNIKERVSRVKTSDIKEAALFCAVYSQAWRKPRIKKDVLVDIFLGKDIYKNREMKIGTFGVRKAKKIIVKKADIKKFQEKMKHAS